MSDKFKPLNLRLNKGNAKLVLQLKEITGEKTVTKAVMKAVVSYIVTHRENLQIEKLLEDLHKEGGNR